MYYITNDSLLMVNCQGYTEKLKENCDLIKCILNMKNCQDMYVGTNLKRHRKNLEMFLFEIALFVLNRYLQILK